MQQIIQKLKNEYLFAKHNAQTLEYGSEYFEGKAEGLAFAFYALTGKHITEVLKKEN